MKKIVAMIKVFDFSALDKRYIGHNFKLCKKLDEEGYKWKIACWSPLSPTKNDYILMGLNFNDVRVAIIEEVERCANPTDMYFLEINIKNAKCKYEQWQSSTVRKA